MDSPFEGKKNKMSPQLVEGEQLRKNKKAASP
jgi:hypothetical protein